MRRPHSMLLEHPSLDLESDEPDPRFVDLQASAELESDISQEGERPQAFDFDDRSDEGQGEQDDETPRTMHSRRFYYTV